MSACETCGKPHTFSVIPAKQPGYQIVRVNKDGVWGNVVIEHPADDALIHEAILSVEDEIEIFRRQSCQISK